jgi:hypothetical protein
MPKEIVVVNMNEVRFNSEESSALVTEGITTCIAFIIQGSFWDEDDDKVRFCGLYHWPGFDSDVKDKDKVAQETLLFFLTKLRDFSGADEDAEITIDTLAFVGGEKEQRDNMNEIIISGTEAEVTSLTKAVRQFDFKKHHYTINPEAINHHHFLTKDEQTISIELTLDKCTAEIISPLPTEESDSDLSMGLL